MQVLQDLKMQCKVKGPEKSSLDLSMLKIVIKNENLFRYFRDEIDILKAIFEYWTGLDPESAKTDEEME